MDNLWMIMPALITTIVVICFLAIVYRLLYIRAYKAGALAVLKQWKLELEEEIKNDDNIL